MVAAIYAIYNTGKLIWQFKDEIFAAFGAIIGFFGGAVIKGIEKVTDAFKWMYDRVVGNSYVPDMIDEIEIQFARLEAAMVQPALTATGQVTSAFRNMSGEVTSAVAKISGSLAGDLAEKFAAMNTGISWTAYRPITSFENAIMMPPPPPKPKAKPPSNLAGSYMAANMWKQDPQKLAELRAEDERINALQRKENEERTSAMQAVSPMAGAAFGAPAMSQMSAPVYNIQVSNITLPDVTDARAFFDQLIEEASRRARAGGGNPFVNLMEA